MITEMAVLGPFASVSLCSVHWAVPGTASVTGSLLRAWETQHVPSSSVAQAGWLGGRGRQESLGGTVTLFPQSLELSTLVPISHCHQAGERALGSRKPRKMRPEIGPPHPLREECQHL